MVLWTSREYKNLVRKLPRFLVMYRQLYGDPCMALYKMTKAVTITRSTVFLRFCTDAEIFHLSGTNDFFKISTTLQTICVYGPV